MKTIGKFLLVTVILFGCNREEKRLEAELEICQNNFHEMESENEGLKNQIEELSAKVEELEDDLQETQDDLQKSQYDLRSCKNDVDDLEFDKLLNN